MTSQETIEAFYELTQAKARYCYTLDSRDWAGFADLMSEDIEVDVTDGNTAVPVITGRDNAVEMIRSSLTSARTAHQVHTPLMRASADEAQVIWAMQDRVVWADGPALTGYGHYHERWVRRDGQWKLASLKLTRTIMEFSSTGDSR
ncbi:MAG TPA: nuclear transport factor 2 family protein [Mycobacterium sp.]|nr:nuclear transport factor 2 family protein [Mycobacterium sp.]